MGHSSEFHITVGDSLEKDDAGVREYIHDAMEAIEHGLTANEFRMQVSTPVDAGQHRAA